MEYLHYTGNGCRKEEGVESGQTKRKLINVSFLGFSLQRARHQCLHHPPHRSDHQVLSRHRTEHKGRLP